FYPFPPFLSRFLSFLLPSFAWGLFVSFKKTQKEGVFLDCLYRGEVLETPFYGGPQNPPASKMQKKNPVRKLKKSVKKSKPLKKR
ncbi:MAG: hypothetical protein OEZ34_02175, partial [Spirochaetia bacterium]|nr:hypothetical protein [Spirochaetia bacterium]